MPSNLAYKSFGEGSTHVIFIHGYCERKEMWSEALEHFALNSTDHTFWAIDLPGFGESLLDEKITSLDDVAEAINDFLQYHKITKAHFIGHSLGGYVICSLLKNFSQKIIKACLLHSSVFADAESKKAGRNKTISFLEKHGLTLFIRNFIPELYTNENKADCQSDIEKGIELGLTTPLNTAIEYMRFMRDRTDSSHFLTSCSIPIHFVVGTKDRSITLDNSLKQLHYPMVSTALILENTGHMGMFEKKYSVLSSLSAFLGL